MKIHNKKFIYLISPNEIVSKSFYNILNLVLKTNKVKFFQLRLKKQRIEKKIMIAKKVLKICKRKPVSFEVFADDLENMIVQGTKISDWGKNVYVKVPVINSRGKFTGKVIKNLNSKNIKLNITAVYTAEQTKKILKFINKKTKVIISIFAGRAADTGKDPIPEFVRSIKLAKKYKNVEIFQVDKSLNITLDKIDKVLNSL